MSKLDTLLDELVTANRILAREEVVDSFGHISVRHPDRPDRFFLSCSRAPERVKRDDLVEFNLDCEPIDAKGKHLYDKREAIAQKSSRREMERALKLRNR